MLKLIRRKTLTRPLLWVSLKSISLPLLFAVLGGCAIVEENPYSLPAVNNPSATATVQVKSQENASDVQFIHLLSVNDNIAMKLEAGDKGSFPVDEGSYTFKVTCHAVPMADLGRPVNLNVVDGVSELEADLKAGDEVCLKISKPLLTCAKIEDVALSRCL